MRGGAKQKLVFQTDHSLGDVSTEGHFVFHVPASGSTVLLPNYPQKSQVPGVGKCIVSGKLGGDALQ